MNVVPSRATLRAIASWLREARAVTGLAALPAQSRERAHQANERLSRMIRHSRRGR
jgi:hypothetical protein